MKLARFLLLLLFVTTLHAQTVSQPVYDQVTSRAFLEQLLQDGIYNFISTGVADSLLEHRVDIVWPHHGMGARITGTVIVAFEISKDGQVMHPMAVSGPALLRAPVVKAIAQWKFRPYKVNNQVVAVAVSYPLRVSNY